MTGGDDGNGHLVIALPWVKPEFGSQYGGPLASPDGWPRLPPPDPGETVAAFIDRAIVGDSFLQLITPLTSDRRPAPSLDGRRPADLTLAWWERKWPYKVFDRMWDDSPPRGYHRDRVYWRLVVEWFDRLRDGDLTMRGHRTDIPAYPLEAVERGLFRNHYMELRPHAPEGGWFRPLEWRGDPAPPGLLRRYRELTLWPAGAAKSKRKSKQEQLSDALVLLHRNGVDVLSPAMQVDVLHAKVGKETSIQVAKTTFERALKEARKRITAS